MSNIYRYNLSAEISHQILCFSKLNEYDERHDYKEKWDIWCKNNEEIITSETERLYKLGYTGDVVEKMYKSSRYYFRKKKLEKNIPKRREQYISLSKELLYYIDSFIKENLKLEMKPKDMFIRFCEINDKLIQSTIYKLNEIGINEREEINFKIKKTFKNRYFNLTH